MANIRDKNKQTKQVKEAACSCCHSTPCKCKSKKKSARFEMDDADLCQAIVD